jgi:Lsr2
MQRTSGPPARTYLIPHERSGDIRTWAKGQSTPVSERGRIPASIVQQPGSRLLRTASSPRRWPLAPMGQ